MKFFLSLLFAVYFVFAPLVPQAHAAAPTDYVSCWDFDESSAGAGAVTRFDANTTNSNDLTDVNTTASAAGKIGNAIDIERGNSEYLTITDASQVGLDGLSAWSYFVWVNFESTPSSGQNYGLIGKRDTADGATYAYNSEINNNAGTMRFRAELYTGAVEEGALTNWTPSTATWYHIGWTFDGGTKTWKYYVNGAQQGSDIVFVTNNSIRNTTAALVIGKPNSDPASFFDGLMDVSEYYNRVLSGTEITDIYNSGTGVACTGRAGGGGATVDTTSFMMFE